MLVRRTLGLQFSLHKQRKSSDLCKYLHSFIDVSSKVTNALKNGEPVVALETTILTHGMPYPANLQTARNVEDLITRQGSVPATIGVLQGRIKVGLDEYELQTLASLSKDHEAVKISRRDFPVVLNKSLSGGTTVCGTLLVANIVGIDVFVTGGIGGVHRDVNETMDVSADIIELAKSPIMVVSSGIKSILDIGRTMELLETMGICVLSYGQSNDFPAFYCRKSGYRAVANVMNAEEAADTLLAAKKLGSGILLGVPIPEPFALDENEMRKEIDKALEMAKTKGICGKSLTPFLLQTIGENTAGNSLKANIALIENNAVIGGQIAHHYCQKKRCNSMSKRLTHATKSSIKDHSSTKIVVIGGSVLDILIFKKKDKQIKENSNQRVSKANISLSVGGVGRNMADAIARLWPENLPYLISAVGDDTGGLLLRNSVKHVNSNGMFVCKDKNTASYAAVAEGKCGSSAVFENLDISESITPQKIFENEDIIAASSLLIFDGNLPSETIDAILQLCQKHKTLTWFEPTDWFVAAKPFMVGSSMTKRVDFMSPNLTELQAIAEHLTGQKYETTAINDSLDQILLQTRDRAVRLLPFVPNIMVTLGKHGVMMASKSDNDKEDASVTYYKSTQQVDNENVYGTGDCMAAGFIVAMLKGSSEARSVSVGMNAALQALVSTETIPRSLRYAECDQMPNSFPLPLSGKIEVF